VWSAASSSGPAGRRATRPAIRAERRLADRVTRFPPSTL
jgi:hypothetical protein